MTSATLLRELESLSHHGRMRRLVEIGRLARQDRQTAAVLAELEQGGWYERLLSLQACHGTRDSQRALRGLSDPSAILRGRAARILLVVGNDADIGRGLLLTERKLRVRMLRNLRKMGRLGVIDAHLDELARRDDRNLEVLLPLGSEKALKRHLDRALARGGVVFWSRLARHHPARARELLRQQAETARRQEGTLVQRCRAVLPILADRQPDQTLELVGELLRRVPSSVIPWQSLARLRPAAVADLVLAPRERLVDRGFFNSLMHRLDRDRLLALIGREFIDLRGSHTFFWGGYRSPTHWLRRLPQALRGELFEASPHCQTGQQAIDLLQLLPAELRHREARRHVKLPALATRHADRLRYAALLPWDEAMPHFEPYLGHPDPALRVASISALALALPTQRQRAADYLALARARKNEQDPVRLAMITALATTPPVVWREEHLDDLGGVIREALDARDLSEGTAAQVQSLILRLLPRHTDWAIGWLTTLVRERGRIGWHYLGQMLTDDSARQVGLALLPILQAWRKRERDQQMIQLASVFGRRLRVLGELVELIEGIARSTRMSEVARQCLHLIAEHDRPRLARLVPVLIREDQSWILFQPVVDYLHRRRQDLLTPFLAGRAVRGKFRSGQTRLVLSLTNGFHRWTQDQQETFAGTLRELIGDADPKREIHLVCQALNQLAALPAVSPETIISRAQDKKPVIRDSALIALARLDSGQGVPVLLEALDDDRARVAIYALRQALTNMPEAHALDLLRQVSRRKVTVAKEVVRLVGEFDSDAAFNFLREVAASKLHRDVHVALLRALWVHLERPEAWTMIDAAVKSGQPALMYTVVRIPSDRLSPAGRDRLANQLADLLRHPTPSVRLEVMQRCQEAPPDDPDRVILPRLLEAVGSSLPAERNAAAQAVTALCTSSDVALVKQATTTLLPNRRGLVALVEAVRRSLAGQRRRLGPVARGMITALAADSLATGLRLRLAAVALNAKQLETLLKEQDAAGWRLDVMMAAIEALNAAGQELERSELGQLEQRLSRSSSPYLRRLALQALVAQAARSGWNTERLARLEEYGRDGDALVAAAAQFTLPTEEEGDKREADEDDWDEDE